LAVHEASLGNLQAAVDIYKAILAKMPDSAEVYNNRGAILFGMKRLSEALASYDKAIQLKADYADAYNNRGNCLNVLKRFDEALASCNKALALNPNYADAYNNRANSLQELKFYPEALASYDKSIALIPNRAACHYNRAICLYKMKRLDEAIVSYDRAIALQPGYVEAHNNRGVTLQELKRFDEAQASCEKVIALQPESADTYNNLGGIFINKGEMQAAEQAFHKALALKPDFPNPLFNLTGIRIYRDATHEDVKTIQALLAKPGIPPGDKDHFYFSLGKIYDDCGLYDEAFACYQQGNQIRNAAVSYNHGGVVEINNHIMDIFNKDFLARILPFASESRSPLFIVGMPRSGTTLLASILSKHHSIGTAGELPDIIDSLARLPELLGLLGREIPYPHAVKHMTSTVASHITDNYEKRLRRDVGAEVPHVIDKHPLNYRHLGFISMLFPNARIIHCSRDPLDTGLSNYFQRFNFDYDYSFDLRNIGHFYREYERIMDHWRKTLPAPMIEVSYEEMTMNTEQLARKTLDALGLEWDERCLSPHTNSAHIETASKWQVRQPIYKNAVERWRHYEKHLAPLKEALQGC